MENPTSTESFPWFDWVGRLVDAGHSVLLYGPPGTGKSSCLKTDNRICLHGASLPHELVGGVGLKNGNSVMEFGPAASAMTNGSLLIIDELDHASDEVVSTLHGILDHASIAQCRLADGTVVKPQNGFGVLATMNGAPTDIAAALLDRFDAIIYAGTPSPKTLEPLSTVQREFTLRYYQTIPCPVAKVPFGVRSARRLAMLQKEFDCDPNTLILLAGISPAAGEAWIVGTALPSPVQVIP